ncbi:MAG: hypothetical protein KDB21_13315 [Acidimicrobiales bacterium]|nr:hypothetical protein [Acidimicrobiales bacterium]
MTTTWAWVQLFVRQFELCEARPEEAAVVLTEPTTNDALVQTAVLALQQLGCHVNQLVLPHEARAEDPLSGNLVALAALGAADLVIDCTRWGLDHSKSLNDLRDHGTRILQLAGAHPADFEHIVAHPGLARRVQHATELLRGVELTISTEAGTRIRIGLRGAEITGASGSAAGPGTIERWPAGSVSLVPRDDAVSGTIVLMPGDVVGSAASHVRSPVTLVVEHDHICDIQGDSGDADLVRSHLEAFESTEAYGMSSIGWGMALSGHDATTVPFDPTLTGPAARLAAGVVTLTTGTNTVAGREAPGGIEFHLRRCTVAVDGIEIIRDGQLEGGLAPDVYELAARS